MRGERGENGDVGEMGEEGAQGPDGINVRYVVFCIGRISLFSTLVGNGS